MKAVWCPTERVVQSTLSSIDDDNAKTKDFKSITKSSKDGLNLNFIELRDQSSKVVKNQVKEAKNLPVPRALFESQDHPLKRNEEIKEAKNLPVPRALFEYQDHPLKRNEADSNFAAQQATGQTQDQSDQNLPKQLKGAKDSLAPGVHAVQTSVDGHLQIDQAGSSQEVQLNLDDITTSGEMFDDDEDQVNKLFVDGQAALAINTESSEQYGETQQDPVYKGSLFSSLEIYEEELSILYALEAEVINQHQELINMGIVLPLQPFNPSQNGIKR
eukprot:CAMPEP_0117892850 /NCGR_PEP_ID=MMETSP0950-20121206/24933_1 /TAXON_ID=44440 /ORGANISM="Chattonella subsalsa, Strain CCMP2191" /LENGTH=272 /DNA_ID=CAMNT_0005752911 /DNA_START=223 /DNA_END=1043 /DNA_ORIENTATION=-